MPNYCLPAHRLFTSPLAVHLQVNEEVGRYNKLLQKFADAKEDEWEAIVALDRGDLQRGFFDHMQVCVVQGHIALCLAMRLCGTGQGGLEEGLC